MKSHWTRYVVALLLATSTAAHAASPDIATRTAKGAYEDVRDRVLQAIEARGLVLNYTARIGDMLERTGKDIGAAKAVYAKAELFEFCSARLSRDMMEADPHSIVHCPYAIAVYTLTKESGRVHVSYRRAPSSGSRETVKALRAVEKLLADIVGEALK